MTARTTWRGSPSTRRTGKSDEFLGLPLVDAEERHIAIPAGRVRHVRGAQLREDERRCAPRSTQAMTAAGYRLVSYVSSRCSYLSQTPPGDNCFILEDNTVQPFVTIGNNVTLWSGNHIGHDATIEDHCFITSHVVISGYVRVGTRSFIGVNATLRNSITIAPQTLIGAGAIIMKNTRPKEVYMPERAKLFSKTSDEIEL